MDTGAQQDVPDTGANASSAKTAENAGAGNKSAGIDKGKSPEVPKIQTDLASASLGQAMPAAPEKPAPNTPALEKTTAAPAKTGTFKMMQIIKTTPVPTKAMPGPAKTAPAPAKAAPASSAMTLHTGKGRPGLAPSTLRNLRAAFLCRPRVTTALGLSRNIA
jgi:hypothetical protein